MPRPKRNKPTAEMKALLARSGDNNFEVAMAAMRELVVALTLPLKDGVLKGDIIGDIFEAVDFEPGAAVEFPLSFLSPGTEKEFVAVTIPNSGAITSRHVEGDYLMVPTFDVGASCDCNLKYLRQARWDVMGRLLKVLEAMFVRKNNQDGWHVLLASGATRNIVAYDDAATAGLFTKRLISLMTTLMRRSAGGNSTSINKGKLTDVYMSPESTEDVRSWDLTQIPDAIRTQIFLAGGGEPDGEVPLTRIFGRNIHDIDELGVGQEFQSYFTSVLGGTMPTDKKEIVVGLDLLNRDSFVNPVRQELELFEDPTFHRSRQAGMYGWMEHGYSALDNRRVLLGAV